MGGDGPSLTSTTLLAQLRQHPGNQAAWCAFVDRYHYLLDAIATHRVADRPDRYEPRLKKQRRNHYDWLTKPRAEIKRKMAKGVSKI